MSTPAVEYLHLPGEEHNPLMESTTHATWIAVFLMTGVGTLAGTGNLLTGNLALDPGDGRPRPAPDVMVVPGGEGRQFTCYRVGIDGPAPLLCLEIVSKSNSRAKIRERCRRFLDIGVDEVYVLDPHRDTVVRVQYAGGELIETSAVGTHSPAMNIGFARRNGQLALCCYGNRLIRPGDDTAGWTVDEQRRADRAELMADTEAARADTEAARAETEAARADTEAARAETEAARAETEAARAETEAARAATEAARADEALAEVAALRAKLAELEANRQR